MILERKNLLILAALVAAGLGTSLQAPAQTPITPVTTDHITAGTTSQRDVNQQQRIENGLQSGSLSTGEAAQLEKDQSRVDRLQTQAMKDGKFTAAEKAKVDAAQDAASRQIWDAKHDDKTGHPNSTSSQNMQQQVQRNVNQQQRIHDGIASNALSNKEAARLQRREAASSRLQAAAGADGHMGDWEQRQLNRVDNADSRNIHQQKHDKQFRKGH